VRERVCKLSGRFVLGTGSESESLCNTLPSRPLRWGGLGGHGMLAGPGSAIRVSLDRTAGRVDDPRMTKDDAV